MENQETQVNESESAVVDYSDFKGKGTSSVTLSTGSEDYDKYAQEDSVESSDENPSGSESVENERPEWLPEKFKSVEDMAKAYSELEKKLGAPKNKDSEGDSKEAEEESDKSEVDSEEKSEDNSENKTESPLDFDKYTKEFTESNDISEESKLEIEKLGIPREIIDQYVKSLQMEVNAAQESQQKAVNEIYEIAGGQENYSEIITWASENVDESLANSYNKNMDRGDVESAKVILSLIVDKYNKENGFEGTKISATPANTSKDAFNSWHEVTMAMNDPRYDEDPHYAKMIEEKISRSRL